MWVGCRVRKISPGSGEFEVVFSYWKQKSLRHPTTKEAGVGGNRSWSVNLRTGAEALGNSSKFKNRQDVGSHIASGGKNSDDFSGGGAIWQHIRSLKCVHISCHSNFTTEDLFLENNPSFKDVHCEIILIPQNMESN